MSADCKPSSNILPHFHRHTIHHIHISGNLDAQVLLTRPVHSLTLTPHRMVSLKLSLTSILAPLLVASSACASFAVCVGVKDAGVNRVLGFHLWNDDSKQSANYQTTNFATTKLENNGWMITPMLAKPSPGYVGGLRTAWVEHTGYKVSFDLERSNPVCEYYTSDNRYRGLNFWCFENDNKGWCNTYRARMRWMCGDYLDMGQNSVSCNPSKRPTP